MKKEEKLEYVKYLYDALSEIGEPIESSKLRFLRDIIYNGSYALYDNKMYDSIIQGYFINNGYSIEGIVMFIRNKKIDSIFS